MAPRGEGQSTNCEQETGQEGHPDGHLNEKIVSLSLSLLEGVPCLSCEGYACRGAEECRQEAPR